VSTSTVALVHSPLTSATAWGEVPTLLRDAGVDVIVPEVFDDDEPPFATRFVARVALQLAGHGTGAVTLVGHGDAGPLLPQIAVARRAAGHPVTGYVFVDAALPRTAQVRTRLDLLRLHDAAAATGLRSRLESDERWPDWSERELADTLPDVSDRAMLLAGLRPRRLDYFTEPLPLADDWPDARCAYLRLSHSHAVTEATARHRGWAVASLPLHHFAMLTNGDEVAAALLGLLRDV
jgi:hypothetical protein